MRLFLTATLLGFVLILPVWSREITPNQSEEGAARLYHHLSLWHEVQGTLPFRALTSHAENHPMKPGATFFFIVEGPKEIRNSMYGTIYRPAPAGVKPTPVLHIYPYNMEITNAEPAISAGFHIEEGSEETTNYLLDENNPLPLSTGTYWAVFMRIGPDPDDPAQATVFKNDNYVWSFTVSDDGEDLHDPAITSPPNPAPTLIPRNSTTLGILRYF